MANGFVPSKGSFRGVHRSGKELAVSRYGEWLPVCPTTKIANPSQGEVVDEVLSKLWSANEFVLARDKLLAHAIHWPSSIGVPG
jgi:hypothetical protein